MDPSERAPARRFDWRGWLMVAWVAWFGYRYAAMVWDVKARPFVEAALSKHRGAK